ncbi:MAG: hypothetical protein WD184_05745 [Acidimicrobiia bacterium]
MAIKPLSPEVVAGWVDSSTAAQGVPAKVTDPNAVEAVSALLGEGREPVEVKDATPA